MDCCLVTKKKQKEDKYETGMQQLYQEFDFIDNNTGKPLKHDLAIQARRTEIEFFRKMRV